jgi:hypothetical protein
MKAQWDYIALADAYLNRPDYADAAQCQDSGAFNDVSIEVCLLSLKTPRIQVPYSTDIWVARFR